MKKLIPIVSLFLSFSQIFGQQIPYYNHAFINPYVFNPGYTGYTGTSQAFLTRSQHFAPYRGGLTNHTFSVDGSFLDNKAGFGLLLNQNTQGIQQQLSGGISFAYGIALNDKTRLRFGFTAGALDNRIETSAINVSQANDPFLVALRPNSVTFDANVGLALIAQNFQIGLGIPQVIGNKVRYDSTNTRGYYQLARHFMFNTNYRFWINEQKGLSISPFLMSRFVPNAPIQYDGGLHLSWKDKGWISATYKANYSIQANIGLIIARKFQIGYSYEVVTGNIKTYSNSVNHEILVGFNFGGERKPEVIKIVEQPTEQKVDKSYLDLLSERNKELEAQLLKIRRQQDSLKVQESMVVKEIDIIETKIAVRVEEIKLDETRVINAAETATIPVAKGYKFIEMDGSESPDGIYVIAGVYSEINNAERTLNQERTEYPDVYIVKNAANKFYYVVILYTTNAILAKREYQKFITRTNQKAWILNYMLEDRK